MSADSAVTYTSVHSEARSWSIPSEDPYEEATRPRALEAEMNAIGSSLYRSLHPSGTPPWLPISTPSTSRRARIPKADTPPQSRPLLATPRPGCEVGESSAAATRRQGPTMAHVVEVFTRESSEFCTRHYDAQKDRAAVRAEIEVLRSERLAYEQDGIQTRETLARSEAHCRALEARVAVLETHVRRLERQRQAVDDFAVEHIMHTQALEAGSIPSEDPYEEATRQLFEQAPYSPEYVPRDHVPVFVPEFEHPDDLVPAEDAQKDRAAVRAEIEVLRSERLAYEQEGIQTRETLARSEAHCRALEVRVAVLETHARRLEWQRQAVDDFAVEHIMRTQALEAGAHIDTLEDTGSSS
nr:hypothetical protein [Tanacetum cinerariifolium]